MPDQHFINVLPARSVQNVAHLSFVGGQPKLPPECRLPKCQFCGELLTFFFQIAFPEGHHWSGSSLAVFDCVFCVLEPDSPTPYVNRSIAPSMTSESLRRGDDIPDGSLDIVQKTFRLLSFPTEDGVLRGDYVARVVYRPIRLVQGEQTRLTKRSTVGGAPRWFEIDHTPGNYRGVPLRFLMQWRHDFLFDRVVGSPPPPELDLPPDSPKSEEMFYKLFAGAQLYFFGNSVENKNNLYMYPVIV